MMLRDGIRRGWSNIKSNWPIKSIIETSTLTESYVNLAVDRSVITSMYDMSAHSPPPSPHPRRLRHRLPSTLALPLHLFSLRRRLPSRPRLAPESVQTVTPSDNHLWHPAHRHAPSGQLSRRAAELGRPPERTCSRVAGRCGGASLGDRILYSTVDLHAITVPQESDKLRREILEEAAAVLAVGVDP
ncbi:hypothetical protein M427DRAFT_355753 [Gonapodya prolifera JEL478]|uniref:Uncharacterized protein n=1 Tax=Gonapodya prolifera (strain JEL478) TaxID=1344416 RepID=A0A139ACR6_GONPJ|nr:hypothetical protein M427DRAFT_355753 [Gonapodya prolifera JEL478]|eukprot:KXS14203.1 hypothetical protein M427DRAFT_355753 [Gonapodya prolifera JEL478]